MDADRPAVEGVAAGDEWGRRSTAAWRTASAAALLVSVLFLCLFLLYPLARILVLGFGPVIRNGARVLAEAASDSRLGRVLLASAGQALLSTALTLAAGLPAAWVFARFDFRGKGFLRVLLGIPFVLPTVVASAALLELIGSNGLITRAVAAVVGVRGPGLSRTLAAVLMAHVFYNTGIVVRIVGSAWASLDPRLGEAARTLGASRRAAFLSVGARLLLPSVAASALLVFAFCFSSFGVILILGGPRMATLETEIYRQAVNMFNLPAAAMLSVVQLVVTTLVMFAYSRLQALAAVSGRSRPENAPRRRASTPAQRALVLLFGLGPAAGLAVPLAALAAGSVLSSHGFSIAWWRALFETGSHSLVWTSPLLAAGNSLLFALQATLIALLLGIPVAYAIARGQASGSRARGAGSLILDVFFLLPLGTSAVTLGFGFIVATSAPPLNLRGSAALIPIAHSLVALPLVIRSLLPALRSLDPRLREAAATLGAGPARAWRAIDLPMLSRSFAAAAAFAFTVSLGEFGATALLTRPELITLPVLIFNVLGRPGESSQGQALALSTLLMAACGLGLALIERFRAGGREML
jgi:thiamine transport system permease protein